MPRNATFDHAETRTPVVAIIGALSLFFQLIKDELPAAVRYELFDIKPPPPDSPHPFTQLRPGESLARLLKEKGVDIAHIFATHGAHAELIHECLLAEVAFVLCEKPIGVEPNAVAKLCEEIEQSASQVIISDAYIQYPPFQAILDWRRALGKVKEIMVSLREQKGVSAAKIAAHSEGMPGFLHHGLSITAKLLPFEDVQVLDAAWARHPDTPPGVPDTYRRLELLVDGAKVTLEAGKYFPADTKTIVVSGENGTATWDRNAGKLMISRQVGSDLTVVADPGYRGFSDLYQTILDGFVPERVLDATAARRIAEIIAESEKRWSKREVYS